VGIYPLSFPENFAMKSILPLALFAGALFMSQQMLSAQDGNAAAKAPAATTTPLNVEMKTIAGKDVNLAKKYEGKVILLVNVASQCGNTPQYEQLQALHKKYADQGLAIVGVPCNQFREQEKGTDADILKFCTETYGVEFDMMSKVDVNGDSAAPLYKFLTSKESNPKFGGNITWNFEKFIFSREGQVAGRFAPRTKPDAPDVLAAIEAELAKKSTVKPTEMKAQPAVTPGSPN
jgi:glutathione peroxidase